MIWPSFEHFSEICHLPSENYKNQLLGLTLNFLQFLCMYASCWHIPMKSRDHKHFIYVWHFKSNMQKIATRPLRTQGKVRKMEMLTKLGRCWKFKSGISFLAFEKTKNMEPSKIKFQRAPCFLFFQNLKKKCTFCFCFYAQTLGNQ